MYIYIASCVRFKDRKDFIAPVHNSVRFNVKHRPLLPIIYLCVRWNAE